MPFGCSFNLSLHFLTKIISTAPNSNNNWAGRGYLLFCLVKYAQIWLFVVYIKSLNNLKERHNTDAYLHGALAFPKAINSLFHEESYLNFAPTHSCACK